MIYIETGSTDVYYNFALEYYFTTEKKLDDTVFLFWRTTPTLMVGKYQNTLEEIDKAYAEAHDITLVRRMSGGGTIYTDLGGWQFTFIQQGMSDKIGFKDFATPIINALHELGVNAEFNGRNDVVIDGKKFSGNAQYVQDGCIVHHGSLLFDTNIEQMVASTTVDAEKILSKSIKSVRDRVTNIKDHLTQEMDVEIFKNSIVRHIMNGIGKTYVLTEEDNKRIKEIAVERFNNWEAIFGANPKFNIEYRKRFAGGKLQFKLDVHKGIIKHANVYGDFFSTMSSEKICESLIGCKYEKTSIYDSLKENGIEGAIYNISIDEITEMLVN